MKSFFNTFRQAPGHLRFVSILSFVNITYSMFVNIMQMLAGPASKDEIKKAKAAIYEQNKAAEEVGGQAAEWVMDTTNKLAKMVDYTNANFVLNYSSSLIILFLGLVGVLFMIQRKAVGFHMYIVYSLAAVAQVYLIAPAKDVPTFMIVTNLVISFIFVLLFARNIKWIQGQDIEPKGNH